jgi:hypothetical protein
MALNPDSLEHRARQADKIVKNPSKYQVCLGCDSIVAVKAALCPSCHGYRFDTTEELIISQAQELGQRERRSILASDLS